MAEYTLNYTGAQIDNKLATMATVDYVNSAISGQAIDIVQESGTSTTSVMSQKAVTDYVTSQVSSVMPEFVDSVDPMTDTAKKYVYNGTIWVYGETYVETENLWKPSEAKLNYRISGTSEAAANGCYISGYMPVDMSFSDPLVIRFSGEMPFVPSAIENANAKVILYDANKSVLSPVTYLFTTKISAGSNTGHLAEADGSDYTIDLGYVWTGTGDMAKFASYDKIAYFRINYGVSAGSSAITIDDVADCTITIDGTGGTKSGFYDTGMEWSAGGGSGSSADLVVQVNNNTAAIAELEDAVEDLASGSGTVVTIPDHWQEKYDSVVESVKALQVTGGADAVSFCWFSDLHYVPTSEYTKNVGKLCAAVMNECDIPFTLFTGDTTTASGLPTEAILLDYIDGAQDMLSPIGHENLLTCWGNHDDVWGTYTPSGGTTVHFVNKVASPKMWYHMHRLQAKDTRRHYGEHGTYFYVDDNPKRVRFICLNCQFYDGGAISGATGQMTGNYGTEQLDWLENVALDVPSGYSVIIATHNPPTAQTINGATYYLSQISDGEDLRSIIQASTADIIAIFAGHCHADAYVSGDLKCPIVTITSAVNTPYDADWSTRVAGTDTETAIDVVTINKKTRKINCTRLGYGSDREISY